ncbi:transposase [Bradyrhizobium zhanjiangense]|uniref:Transposase n=1 Tax=Bradyrhizobium zhanjiangense TaxID=1325107 RepID=A0ABY0D9N9_9BRAD|nr:transposase [Bradyrhizobium zhanjiangense]RXG86645.1 transposase [Bradyrhizobium zhanjiangense]
MAGEKVFIDYSGKKIGIADPAYTEIFVAVTGASNYTYAEATWTQALADWIERACSASSAAYRAW